ncbi:MAG TPA: VOC family protein [Planctomycetota bacterium]
MAGPIGFASVLAVRDLAVSKPFWIQKLGFEVRMEDGGWLFLKRGAFFVHLGECPDAAPITAAPDHAWFAYVKVDDATALHDEYVGKGVEIWHPIADKEWGMREFAIVTVDGHRIVFGQDLGTK